jgi:hypothetical protein
MTRVKALYRSWGIPCSGTQVYSRLYRVTWLSKITEPGVRLRAARRYRFDRDCPQFRRRRAHNPYLSTYPPQRPRQCWSKLTGSV